MPHMGMETSSFKLVCTAFHQHGEHDKIINMRELGTINPFPEWCPLEDKVSG